MIFMRFFGNKNTSTIQERMETLRSRFTDSQYLSYLCLLNAVFDVDFPKTAEYNKLSEKQKYEGLKKLFVGFVKMVSHKNGKKTKLAPEFGLIRSFFKVFKTLWVIAIDDSEYVDDESWLLIKLLLDLNVTFFVVTMGSQKTLSTLALEVLRSERIKVIELKAIDKWYHVGLACQMLHVDGIPPELEK